LSSRSHWMSPGKLGCALAMRGDARNARTKKAAKRRVCTAEE
jgi:hypothetical protein